MRRLAKKGLMFTITYSFNCSTINRWIKPCTYQPLEGEIFTLGVDKFLYRVNHIYINNENSPDGLLCCLLKGCIAKISGNPNPKYPSIVLNLFLALASSVYCKNLKKPYKPRSNFSLSHIVSMCCLLYISIYQYFNG